NSASSRAIPVEKQLQRVLDDPFIPVHWGVNQRGMQAASELTSAEIPHAEATWLTARDYAVLGAVALIGGVEQLQDESLQSCVRALQDLLEYKGSPSPAPLH